MNDFSFILPITLPPICNCILKDPGGKEKKKTHIFTAFFTEQTEREGTQKETDCTDRRKRGKEIYCSMLKVTLQHQSV